MKKNIGPVVGLVSSVAPSWTNARGQTRNSSL